MAGESFGSGQGGPCEVALIENWNGTCRAIAGTAWAWTGCKPRVPVRFGDDHCPLAHRLSSPAIRQRSPNVSAIP